MTQRSVERGPHPIDIDPLGRATPMEMADLLLWALVELHGAVTIMPEAGRGTHAIGYERSGVSTTLATVPSSFGDALAARLAIVAGLAVGLPGAHVARLRVRPNAPSVVTAVTELLIALRTTLAGLEAEVHRMDSSVGPQPEDDASPQSLAAGRGRVGMYRIAGILGQGGMGVVYLAEHVALEKRVALKVLHAEAAHHPKLAAQFLVEARAACRARHPGIVDVTDFGALGDGRAYLVMELVTWPTLAEVLRSAGRPLSVARSVAILRNVAEALAAAASHSVVHRDLTPANIFVGPNDATKIGDFGLARIVDRDAPGRPTAGGGYGGTAGYMSPEQWLGEPSDTRSDIYSLGVILFRMLTSHMPYASADPLALLQQQQNAPVPRAVGEDGPVPDALQQVIERAMAARPAERYHTVDELLLSLRDLELPRSGWTRWLE